MKKSMLLFPSVSLIVASFGFYVLFPEYGDLGDWIWGGIGGIPMIAWHLVGVIAGVGVYFAKRKWPDRIGNYTRNLFLGLLAWLGIAILATVFMEEGDLPERVAQSALLKAWAVLLFASVSMMPTLLGTYALITGSRMAIGGSVFFHFFIGTTVMVFIQAESNTMLEQDPLVSIVTVWALIGFVEGLSWRRRYGGSVEGEEARVIGNLFRRQLASTMIFLAVGTVIAYTPVITGLLGFGDFFGFYEGSTIYGSMAVCAILMIPIIVFALYRRIRDKTGSNGFK